MKCSKCKSKDIYCRMFVKGFVRDFFFYCSNCNRNKRIQSLVGEVGIESEIKDIYSRYIPEDMAVGQWFYVNKTPLEFLDNSICMLLNKAHAHKYVNVFPWFKDEV